MKKLTIIFAVLLFAVTLMAQERDIIYLKNGSVIKGIIVEHILGESVKIKTADGSIFVYPETEVGKIEKEADKPPQVSVNKTPAGIAGTQAQQEVIPDKPKVWTFGGGVNYLFDFYKWTMSESSQGSVDASAWISSKWSGELYARVQYRPSKFALETGLSFSYKGFKQEVEDMLANYGQYYLGVPVTAKYYMKDTKHAFYLYATLKMDFLVASTYNLNGEKFSNSNKLYKGVMPSLGFGFGWRMLKYGVSFPLSSSVFSKELDNAMQGAASGSGYSGVESKVSYFTMSIGFVF